MGCKTIGLDQFSKNSTTQQVSLGSIGLDKDFLLQSHFQNTAIPKYLNPIKLDASIKEFNRHTFNNFTKAKTHQSAEINLSYVDSISKKPKYIQLEISDTVAAITSFNSKENKAVKDYLENNKYANVITLISMALNEMDLDSIANADAIFSIEENYKTYSLQLYKANKKFDEIQFNQGIIFEYQTSNCCWQENKRHQLDIVDLVKSYNNCPNKTYRYAYRAKKKINYYKL